MYRLSIFFFSKFTFEGYFFFTPAAASACFFAKAASCLARMMAASLFIKSIQYFTFIDSIFTFPSFD